MNTVLTSLTLIMLLLTAGVLGYGVLNMINPKRRLSDKSNRLMRWRLIFQALALVCFSLLLWSAKH